VRGPLVGCAGEPATSCTHHRLEDVLLSTYDCHKSTPSLVHEFAADLFDNLEALGRESVGGETVVVGPKVEGVTETGPECCLETLRGAIVTVERWWSCR